MTLYYPVPERDVVLLPVEGPRWPIRWNGTPGGDITVHQPETGQTLHFRPTPGRSEGELCLHLLSDRNGNTISISYDIEGTPQEVVHHGGYRIGVACEDGRITDLTLLNHPDRPSLRRYAYNRRGDLAEIYNSSGLPLKFTYDERHRITGWEDRIGTWYRYTYDNSDRCVAARGVDGILDYTYSYDDDARTATATNSLGHTTRFQFNDSFQLVTETDPLGGTTHRTWDRHDNLLALTDPLERRTECAYDNAGRPVRVQLPDGSVTATEYDDLGLPIATVEPDGATWRQRYDAHGNLVEAVDPTGGHQVQLCRRWPPHLAHRCAREYSVTGDGRGGTPAGDIGLTGRSHTMLARLLRSRRRTDGSDGCHHPHGVDGRRAPRLSRGSRWFARDLGVRRRGERAAAPGPVRCNHRHEVGPFDLPRTRTDPDGAVYQFTYDTEQQLRSVTNPQGRAWTFDLDAVGRLTAERDFNGSDRTYQYDAAGQLTRRSNEAGESVAFTYDLLGNTVTQNCSDGSITTFRHNAVGQLVWARNSDAEVEIQRDPLGRILRESVNGRVVSSVYDALGTPHSESHSVRQWSPGGTTTPKTGPLASGCRGTRWTSSDDACGRDVGRRLGPSTVLTQSWSPDGHLVGQRRS
ncbi:hypothetical protein SVIOM342S_09477 [Streptomyces violaceorubidus]